MKLSIIIPIFNTEKYLVRCLDSVFSQDLLLSDYEVIAINDGSTDNSFAILKEYKNKYQNLIIVNQKNKGEASTRNKALKMARGKYITFVDSDDAIETNTFKNIIERAESYSLDILYLKIDLYDERGRWLNDVPNIGEESMVLTGFEHERRPYPATIYLRQLIGNIKFPSDVLIGPDTVFNAIVQTKAKRCSSLSIPYYRYTYRLDSLSKQGRTEKAYLGFLNAINFLENFRNTNFPKCNEIQKKYFDTVTMVFISRILQLNILPSLDKKKFEELKQLLKYNQIAYLETYLAKDFPFFDKSFFQFYLYNFTSKNYFAMLGLLSKIKGKFIH